MNKKILFIDMDNVIVDFMSGVRQLHPDIYQRHVELHGENDLDEIPGVFALMEPLPNAIESVVQLSEHFDTYLLSSSPWLNPSAWSDKVEWVHRHFGHTQDSPLYKRLILSHNKHLNTGDFLVDDRPNNGADKFGYLGRGEWIQFGAQGLEDWVAVREHLMRRITN